jgi:predicted porin
VTTVGGQYNLGFATVALGYQTTDRLSASAATAPASAATLPKHSAYNIGVIYPATKDLSLRVQYTESKTKIPVVGTTPASTRDYERTGVSARYAFSPRTFGYAAYVDRKVDVPTAANNKNVVGVGISHAF